ncbi:MAG: ABC transporter substrate-binding protein [Ilumatobacteraceae bacterium]
MKRLNRFTRTALIVSVSLVAISACSSDDNSASTTTAAAADSTPTTIGPPATTASSSSSPVTAASTVDSSGESSTFSVEAANGTVSLEAKAMKIVSLSPTHTEMLFAIGAGDQVIAVDDQSNFPAEAAAVQTDLSGYTPNVEAIAGYKPDLVVIADDSSGLSEQLAGVNIPVWSGASAVSFDDVYTQLEQLGVLTGHIADAAGVVAGMQSDIADLTAKVPATEVPLTYYHELDTTYFSVTSDTFIGQIYALAGLQNIADQANATSSYPQLSSELIVSANPDLIFLADTKYGGSVATVVARDGWAGIAAVVNGNVIEMDDDIASRWGPRVVDYFAAVVEAVQSASIVAPA